MRHRLALAGVIAAVLTALLATPVAAGKPEMQRVVVDVQVTDPFLSQACGFPVTVTVVGQIMGRTWLDAQGNPVREIFTINVHGTFSAGGASLHFVDAGMDKLTFLEGGALRVEIHGNLGLVGAKGQGPVLGAAGRIAFVETPLFDEAGNPILDEEGNQIFDFQVLADTGLRVEDLDAFCTALSPPA